MCREGRLAEWAKNLNVVIHKEVTHVAFRQIGEHRSNDLRLIPLNVHFGQSDLRDPEHLHHGLQSGERNHNLPEWTEAQAVLVDHARCSSVEFGEEVEAGFLTLRSPECCVHDLKAADVIECRINSDQFNERRLGLY